MKKFIFSSLLFLLLFPALDVSAASDTSTLKPQLIEGSWRDDQMEIACVYRNGEYIFYPGDATFYQVGDQKFDCTYSFKISFYNVGMQSSNSEHAKAVLTTNFRALEEGDIITAPSTFREDPRLGPRWTIYSEPAASAPEEQFRDKVYNFSGGIDGTFMPIDPQEKLMLKLEKTESNIYVVLSGERNLKIDITPYSSAFWGNVDSGTRFSGITGVVEMRLPWECKRCWHAVKQGTIIPVGAHIRTEDDSACVLSFPDLSTFVLKDNAEIIIDAPPSKDTKVELLKGSLWSNVKEIFKTGSMEIEMNQAVAGIKGTTFALSDDGQTSTIKVIEGVVSFKSKATGESKDVSADQMLSADAQGLSALTDFDATAETAEWDKINQNIDKGATIGETTGQPKTDNIFDYWYLLPIMAAVIAVVLWFFIKRS